MRLHRENEKVQLCDLEVSLAIHSAIKAWIYIHNIYVSIMNCIFHSRIIGSVSHCLFGSSLELSRLMNDANHLLVWCIGHTTNDVEYIYCFSYALNKTKDFCTCLILWKINFMKHEVHNIVCDLLAVYY